MNQLRTIQFVRTLFLFSLVAASTDAQENDRREVSTDTISTITGDDLTSNAVRQCDLRNLQPPAPWKVNAQGSVIEAVTSANRCLAQRDTVCAVNTINSVAVSQLKNDDERALLAIPQADLAIQRGDKVAASDIYRQALDLPNVDAALRLEIVRRFALMQHDAGQYADVLRLLNTNFSCSNWSADALTLRALAYEGLFANRLALESFESAINLYQRQGRPLPAGLQGRYQALASRHDPSDSSPTDVVPLVRIAPDYPDLALRRKREGWVRMQFDITDMGTVANARVVDSSDPMFDEAALAALRRWRYAPKFTDDLPVARPDVQTIIRFQLQL